jgi:hypothetical protein
VSEGSRKTNEYAYMRTCCCRSSTESKYGAYIGFNLRHVPKNTGICEHHLLPRLGSPVEKAEGEQLMRRCVPSLENKRAVIFDLNEEKSLTAKDVT